MSAPVQQRLAADPAVMRMMLTHLKMGSPGLISMCSDGDGFVGRRFTTDEAGIEAAVAYAVDLDQRRRPRGTYVQVTTLREHPGQGERGGKDLAHALDHLWADGDFGTVGHKPGLDELDAPPNKEAVQKVVEESGLPKPSDWVESGGGYNPVWKLAECRVIGDDEDRARVEETTTGVQAILAAQAYRCGWSWDIGVGNLDRLMKLPGTVNRKEGLERPTAVSPPGGVMYYFEDLAAIVAELLPTARETLAQADQEKKQREADRLGRKVLPPRAPRPAGSYQHTGDGPLDVLADTLQFRDVLEPAGWTYQGQRRDGREAWLRPTVGGDKPSSDFSLLCNDYVAINWSERSGLPIGGQPVGGKLTVGKVFAHLNYGGDTSEAARDIMRAAGGHQAGAAALLPQQVLAEVKKRCLTGRNDEAGLRALIAPDDGQGVDWSGTPAATPTGQAPTAEGAEAEAAPGRGVIFTPASQVKLRRVRWLWDTTPEGAPPTSHGRIPMYSLVIAAGFPGLGKSQYGVWMTARITTGTLPGELYGTPRAVVYAAAEDSWSMTIAPRLIAAGADMDLVFRVDVQDTETMYARLTLPVDTSLLGKQAEEHSVALLVMDPLLSFIDKGINDYKAAEVRQALEPLVAAADRHHFTILGLAHFTKSGAADPVSRVAGSGAFGQLIRALIAFAKEEDDDGGTRFVMSLEKNNLGRLGVPSHNYAIQPVTVPTDEGPTYVSKFVLGPETNTSVSDVMRDEANAGGATDKSERGEAVEWLEDYLMSGPQPGEALPKDAQAAARAAGISPNALREAKKRLKVRSIKSVGHNAPWIWTMPDFIPIADDSQEEK